MAPLKRRAQSLTKLHLTKKVNYPENFDRLEWQFVITQLKDSMDVHFLLPHFTQQPCGLKIVLTGECATDRRHSVFILLYSTESHATNEMSIIRNNS